MEIIKIAGIDPGLRFTGFGIINYDTEKQEIWVSNCGVCKVSQSIKGIDAILEMQSKVEEISERECFIDCDHILIEIPAAIYSKTFSSGALIPMAVVAGGILTMFKKEKIVPIYPVIWNQGRGKKKVLKNTEEHLGSHEEWLYDDVPRGKGQYEHIVDAISMAFWYLKLNYFEEN